MNGKNGGPPGRDPLPKPVMEFKLAQGERWRDVILSAAAECGLEVVHHDDERFDVKVPTAQDAWSFGAACQEMIQQRSHSSKVEHGE